MATHMEAVETKWLVRWTSNSGAITQHSLDSAEGVKRYCARLRKLGVKQVAIKETYHSNLFGHKDSELATIDL